MQTIKLEVIAGGEVGQTAVLSGISVIGRDPNCAFVVPAGTVSREHAVIRPEPGFGFVVEDLDSRSGTFVNGLRVRRSGLQDGDTLKVGPIELRVRTVEDRLTGEVPLEQVEMVRSRHMPTTRLALDAVRFRTGVRDLSDSGEGPLPRPEPPAPLGGLAEPAPCDTVAARLEQLCEISISMASIHQPDRLTRETAMRIVSMFPQARRIGFFELEEDLQGGDPFLRPRYVIDRSTREQGARVQISQSVLQAAIEGRQSVLSEDVNVDPRFRLTASVTEAGVCSMVCVPLCLGERVLGALYVDATDAGRPFDEGALRLITGVAAILAAAFENARLFARVQSETVRRASLERYFSPDLVERVLRGEVPLARQGRLALGTILFVDIRGFTRLTDVSEPTALVATLNAYFAAMQRTIFRNGGTVERFGGDSILAYWGIVEHDPHSSLRAVRAALAMLAEIFRLNPELEAADQPSIRVALGVNTGNVIVGDVGSPERYEFTILGSAINLARRMESLAQAGELIAGADTIKDLRDRALYVPLPPTTVKGRDAPVALSALYGLRVDADRPDTTRYDLAIEATLDLPRGPEIVLVTRLEVTPAATRLELLSASHPFGGAPAKIVLRLPRSEAACTVAGRVRGDASAEETLMLEASAATLPPPGDALSPSGVQRLSVEVSDREDLLRFLAIRR